MTYEYVCKSCGHEWQKEQKITEEPDKTCPSCHAASAQRLVSGGVGTIFRGAGWFKTGGY